MPPATGLTSRFKNSVGSCFRENPSGGGSFVRGRRWLVPYSPLRGCSELAALATAKIPRRSAPRSFQTGSYERIRAGFRGAGGGRQKGGAAAGPWGRGAVNPKLSLISANGLRRPGSGGGGA